MRQFYTDEAPLDTLTQIWNSPVWDGNLVSKSARDDLVKLGMVDRCNGYNVISPHGESVCKTLKLTTKEPDV